MADAFDSFLDNLEGVNRQRAATQLDTMRSTVSPDAMATGLRLAPQTGRNAMYAIDNLQALQKEDMIQRDLQALEKSKGLTDWVLEDPVNAALASDETEGLAAFDQEGYRIKGSLEATFDAIPGGQTALGRGLETGTRGVGIMAQGIALYGRAVQVKDGQRRLDGFLQVEALLAEGKEVDEDTIRDALGLQDDLMSSPNMRSPTSRPELDLRAYAAAPPEQRREMLMDEILTLMDNQEAMGTLAGVIAAYTAQQPEGEEFTWGNLNEWAAFNLGAAIPYLAAMAALTAATGGTGLFVAGSAAGMGEMTSEASLRGMDLTDPDLQSAIIVGSALYGATEFIGIIGRSTRGATREIFAEFPEELVERAAKNVLRRVGKEATLAAGEEGLNELLQGLITEMVLDGNVDITREGLLEKLEQFAAGAIVGGGLSGVTNAPRLRSQKAAVDEAERSRSEIETLAELDRMAEGAKLKQSAPAKFEEYLDRLGYNRRAIHVDAAELQSQIADGSVSPEQLGTTADELAAAAEANTRIAIPTSKYLTNVSGTPLATWFRDNAAMRAEGLTGSELRTFEKVKQDLEAEIALEQAQEREGMSTRQRAYQTLYSQLTAAGQSRRMAKANATVQIAFMETMGARMGIDNIYDRFGVKVQGPPQRAMAQETVTDLREQYYQSPLEFSQTDDVSALQLRPDQAERIARGEIVDEPSVYLYATPDSQRVPLSQVVPIRRRPEGVENAVPLMAAAARGGKRRQPLSVMRNDDGTYTLLDGNSTYAVLEQAGAQELVVREFTPETWQTEAEVDKIRKVLKDPQKKPRVINAGRMDPNTFEVAWKALRRLQPFNSLEEMIDTDAQRADQDYMNALARRIGEEIGVPTLDAPPKNMARSSEKVNGKYNGDQKLLGDSVRTAFTATTLDSARAFLDGLAVDHTLVIEPFAVTPEGYFDQKASILLPSGRWGEIQILPPGMAEAKKGGGHDNYMIFREDKGQYTFDEKMQARNEMLDAYAEVMSNLDPSWLAVLGQPLASNSELAARISETARLYSSSVISGDFSSNSTSSGDTSQVSNPDVNVADPSSSIRTTPGSERKNLGIDAPPSTGNIEASVADSNTPRQFGQGSAPVRRTPATVGATTGIPLINTLGASAEFVRNNQFRTGRDLKLALQERALAGHQAAGIDLTELTDENVDRMADYVFEDALEAVQDNMNAIGWYDNAVTAAKAELSKLYPELAEGGEAEFAFIWALAVTSNGLKVNKNFELAAAAYEGWKSTGAFPKNIGIGTAAKAINEGLDMYSRMIERFGGWEAARDFMISQHPVRDIEAQSGKSITGEGKGEIVRGAAILGPKIGNGFFSNLYGYFDGLTMDRWLMRSVGRWRGTLISINEEMIATKRAQILDLFNTLTPGELDYLQGFFNGSDITLSQTMSEGEIDKLANEVKKRSMTKDWREHINRSTGGEFLRKLGNGLAGYMDGQVEAPGGTKERSFIRRAMQKALGRLQQTPGLEALTMADLQALLWYPEKLMYDSAKKAEGVDVRSYDDDEAPDYANAARNLVTGRMGAGTLDSSGRARSAGPAGDVESGTDAAAPADVGGAEGDGAGGPRPVKSARRLYQHGTQGPADGLTPVTAHDLYNLTPEFFDRPGWAVVTATREDLNPKFKDSLNARANNQLREQLEYEGIPYIEVDGRYEGEYQGTSFLIIADEATASKYGKSYMQESILTNRGLVYTLRPLPTVPATGQIMTGDAARGQDFYSETREGFAFSMGLDFTQGPGQPVLPGGFYYRTDKPQLPIRNADGKVELHHWSNEALEVVDPAFAGSGPLKGVERQRGAQLSFFGINPRQSQRQPGTGYVKESGLGPVHHIAEVDPDQLYDWVNDPQNLAPEGLAANDFTSAYEAAIEAAGYIGYYTVDDGNVRNPRAPLGNVAALFKPVPVRVVPPEGLRQGERGMITIPGQGIDAGEAVIDLFENADESTFMHETGHFMLEVFRNLSEMPEAPASMKEDLAKIHEWMGKTDNEPYTTEQQEMWAEAFEVYLMEGRAPSDGLRGAFTQFARWLTRLYRAAINVGTQPSDDVRGIMDRMLATDAEIAAAREGNTAGPLFNDQAAAGMSDEDWAVYRRVAERSEDEAFRRLLNKTMETIRRKTQKWWREEMKETRAAVMAELQEQPAYRLIERVANLKEDLRIDKDELIQKFGADIVNQISPAQIGGKRQIWQEGGLPLRMVAELFGFANEADMITTLRNTPKLQEAVVAQATDRMEKKHGDPLKEEAIKDEALAALKNGAASERTAREITTLDRQANPSRGPNRWQRQNAEAKATAQGLISRMTVRQIMGYRGFARTSQKYAREAQAHLADVVRRADGTPTLGGRKALMAAAEAKRKQLVNDHLYREARERARKIESFRRRVKRMEKASIRQNIGPRFVEQIDTLLERYEFKQRSQLDVRQRASLRAFINELEVEYRGGEVAIAEEVINDLQQVNYTELNSDLMDAVIDAVDNLAHMGRQTTKAEVQAEAVQLEQVVDNIIENADKNLKDVEIPRGMGERGGLRRQVQQSITWILNASTMLMEIDGKNPMGTAYKAVKLGIDKASQRLQERREEAARFIQQDLYFKHYTMKEVKAYRKDRRFYPELGTTLSKWDLIAMALNTGTQGNFERLTNKDGKHTFDSTSVNEVLARELTEKDWRFVQDTWDYIGSFWGEIAALEKKMTGLTPKKIPAQVMIEGAPEFVTGGYFPIKYDYDLSAMANDQRRSEDALNGFSGRYGKAQTQHGFTKERTATTGQPLVLDMGVIEDHVFGVIHDLELRQPLHSSWKIITHPKFADMMIRKGRAEFKNALELWLQDTAAGERTTAHGYEHLFRWLRGGFTVAKLGFSLSTAMIQPLGITQSSVVVGHRAMISGYKSYMSNPVAWTQFAFENSAAMRERQRTMERDMMQVSGELRTGTTSKKMYERMVNAMVPAAYFLMQKTQYYSVDLPTFVAAYERGMKEGKTMQESIDMAEMMVARAQGSGLMSDRGMLERGTVGKQITRAELPRTFTVLASYMFAKFNLAYQRVGETNYANPGEVLKLAFDLSLMFTVEATLVYLMRNGWPTDEDDEETAKAFAIMMARETGLTALATLPVARDVSSALSGYSGGGAYESYTATLGGVLLESANLATDDDFQLNDVKRITNVLGPMFYFPSVQTNRLLGILFEDDLSLADPTMAEALMGLTGMARN
jgi:hypothetical protein